MSETKKITKEERIAKLAARLAEAKAQLVKSDRKERNGEFMAVGITVGNQFANAPEAVKVWLAEAAMDQTDERTKKKCLAAIERFKGKN